MSIYTTDEIAERVGTVAKSYGVDKMYIFGSYARGEATEASDIDFYVELSRPLGLRFCSFWADVEESVGKPVDIITKDALFNPVSIKSNERLIERILKERMCIYEQ